MFDYNDCAMIKEVIMGKEKKEFMDTVKKIADEKGIEINDEMLDNIQGGYYSNWDQLDRKTQMRLQQESATAFSMGEYCEIFNTESSVPYTG